MHHRTTTCPVSLFLAIILLAGSAFGATPRRTKRKKVSSTSAQAVRVVPAAYRPTPRVAPARKRQPVYSPWKVPTFADSTLGDSVDGEDLAVRRAAVQALGPYNGTVVVADPSNGRILTIVNQKLAYQSGFQPCSTIKVVAALAGLQEGILQNQNSLFRITRRQTIDLTQALAHSNNQFFSTVGVKLGYDKIVQYAQLFGLGEKAGLNLDGEQPGTLASEPPSSGVGMMTSFGEGIYMTPLELAGVMTVVANGGTLYYLQHPRSQTEIDQFIPRVKRRLEIEPWLPAIKPGMGGAVEYGTARRANYSSVEPIFGKTGTCTDSRSPTHLGWFGSYNELGENKLVVVVLLTGGHAVNGPIASGVAGAVYKNLSQDNYFAQSKPAAPIALISTESVSGAGH